MKKIIRSFLVITVFILFTSATNKLVVHQRWNIKTLTDPYGIKMFNSFMDGSAEITSESIDQLTATRDLPQKWGSKNPDGSFMRFSNEEQIVSIKGVITETGFETDGDYHVVIKDPASGKTIVVEIPNPDDDIVSQFPDHAALFSKLRSEIDNHVGQPGHSISPVNNERSVTVTGALFWDKVAHGDGHADNGRELHPVLQLDF